MKQILFAVFLLTIIMNSAKATMPQGGLYGDEKPATDDLNKMLEPLKPELEGRFSELSANGKAEDIHAISFKTQVVKGLNYFIKFRVGTTDEYFHARVHREFDGTVELSSVIGPKKESDPILYFQ